MNKKRLLTIFILLVAIPLTVYFGGVVFREKYYAWLSLCVALLACLPLFFCFERKEATSAELAVISVLVAISVIGRFAFVWLPAFKPITAITVISAVWLGKEAGFAVGALSAVISNFYFGQGPWTPFQMFACGFIGFVAGVFGQKLRNNKVLMCIYGAFSGIIYSLAMDVWTTVWAENIFNTTRYFATVVTSLPTTIGYAVANGVFIFLLAKPLGNKLSRIKKKYGLFSVNYEGEKS